jgi:hypothetical protein
MTDKYFPPRLTTVNVYGKVTLYFNLSSLFGCKTVILSTGQKTIKDKQVTSTNAFRLLCYDKVTKTNYENPLHRS